MTNESKPSKTTTKNIEPLESEVAHLFSFALGVVTGFNASKRGDQLPEFEELPNAYSLAGGSLDYEGGDTLMETDNRWYLIELKRGYANLVDELDKPRVVGFQANVTKNFANHKELMEKATNSHQFLYLGKPRDRYSCELATLSYVLWLKDKLVITNGPAYFKKHSIPFTSFLASLSEKKCAFAFEDLGPYFELLNSGSGGGDAQRYQEMIGVVIGKNHEVQLVNNRKIFELIRSAEDKLISETTKDVRRNTPGKGGKT